MRWRTVFGVAGIGGVALPAVGIGALLWTVNHPAEQDLAMPEGLTALSRPAGQHALVRADRADHEGLNRSFQTQQKGSWCGVASAVTVLNAQGARLEQEGFFTPEVSAVRGYWATTFTGMPLDDLAKMLEAHGAAVDVWHAEDEVVETFRSEVRENLSRPGDSIIVNYDRSALGEVGSGHISPLSAYDAIGDQVLLLDTASYKYEPHWVPVDRLFLAMRTTDPETGLSRGWVGVGSGIEVVE